MASVDTEDDNAFRVPCSGGGLWELLFNREVSLGKIKTVRVTHVVSSVGNLIIRSGHQRRAIVRFRIVDALGHVLSKDILSRRRKMMEARSV